MSAAAQKKKMTVAEYFAIEEKADRKSEFFDGEMFAMAGASFIHNLITVNLSSRIHRQLEGGPCRITTSDQRVKVNNTGLFTYPDLLIVCDKPEFAPENRHTLVNPKVIMEVLSSSTEKYDRTTKFRHYKQLPSVMEYVLVSQDEPLVERYTRLPNGTWAQSDFVGLDASMTLETVPVSVPLADVYQGVEFPISEPRD